MRTVTFDETLAESLYNQGLKDKEIAEKVGVYFKTITRWRKKKGLEGNWMERKVPEENLMRLYMMGYSDSQTAKELSCSPGHVAHWREQNLLPSNSKIFDWQKMLKPYELDLIPEKYRKVAI